MKFKYPELEREFRLEIFPNLRALLFELDHFTRTAFHKEIIITHLLRTQDQQNEFYEYKIRQGFYVIKDGWIYYSLDKQHPTYSVHQVGRGADIRSWIFTPDEIDLICDYINQYFPYREGKPACVYHKIKGNVHHFHFQVVPHGEPPLNYEKFLIPTNPKWRAERWKDLRNS